MKKYTFQTGFEVWIFDSINGLHTHMSKILQEKHPGLTGFPDRTTITNRFRENGKYRQRSFAFPLTVGENQIFGIISEAEYIQTDIYADKKAAKRQLLINRKKSEQCKI